MKLNEFLIKILESGELFNQFRKIEEDINNDIHEFKDPDLNKVEISRPNFINEKDKETLILFEKLSFLKEIYENHEQSLYFFNEEVEIRNQKRKELFVEVSKYLNTKDLEEFKLLLNQLQMYIPLKYNFFRTKYIREFSLVDESFTESYVKKFAKNYTNLITEAEDKQPGLLPYNQLKKSLYVSKNFNESKEVINTVSKIIKERNKELEFDTYNNCLELGVNILTAKNSQKSYSNKINFNIESFGILNKKDINEAYFSTRDFQEKFENQDNKNSFKLYEEILEVSIKNDYFSDMEGNLKNYINFYSNFLFNLCKNYINSIEDKDILNDVLGDFQKLVVSMSYLSNSIENKIMKNFEGDFDIKPLSFLLNYKEEEQNIKKLIKNQPFTDLKFEEFEEIKKIIFSDLSEYKKYIPKNKKLETEITEIEKFATYKENEENDFKIKNSIYKIKSIEENKYILEEMEELKNLFSLFENYKKFFINYERNFYNGIYNRPILLFNTSSSEIKEFILEAKKNINDENDMCISLNKKFYHMFPYNFQNKAEFLSTSRSVNVKRNEFDDELDFF